MVLTAPIRVAIGIGVVAVELFRRRDAAPGEDGKRARQQRLDALSAAGPEWLEPAPTLELSEWDRAAAAPPPPRPLAPLEAPLKPGVAAAAAGVVVAAASSAGGAAAAAHSPAAAATAHGRGAAAAALLLGAASALLLAASVALLCLRGMPEVAGLVVVAWALHLARSKALARLRPSAFAAAAALAPAQAPAPARPPPLPAIAGMWKKEMMASDSMEPIMEAMRLNPLLRRAIRCAAQLRGGGGAQLGGVAFVAAAAAAAMMVDSGREGGRLLCPGFGTQR